MNTKDLELMDKYILMRWQYNVGGSNTDDAVYNSLHDYLKSAYPDWEYVKRSWSDDPCPTELLKKYGLENLIVNVVSTYSSESMMSLRSDDEVASAFRNLNEPTRVSLKIDGWNHQANYFNGKLVNVNTRGRAATAKESKVVESVVPKQIPLLGKVKVIGEVALNSSKWETFKDLTSTTDQRAAVSTAIARDMAEYIEFIGFNIVTDTEEIKDKYRTLQSWGFDTPTFLMVQDYAGLLKAVQMLGYVRDKYKCISDGIVVENKHTQTALRIGEWKEQELYSYVTGYTENTTPYGRSLVVDIRPITSEGKTIAHLDVTNIGRIISNNLRIGYPIVFSIKSGSNPVFNEAMTEVEQGKYSDEDELQEYRRWVNEKSA